ncbi:MAG: Na+/H+ antiporter subunit E [Deltaproteobacteria bacterium]|nr:Na+/H+ antiporter subunit E [Deltaproteobacteria bacterium]MBI2210403.1 Na+/H+ antiporter subunit E [Deltaproteobacteria bacterium]MBI2347122.1 Na+/H+ antiporter subunit E [Deltaproteobacteria bacterium]MBI2991739.1 Na+/H+ antiporter subunit E [Deltaproteobacteria bacterium]MBI3060582.1 Na+/H+ antiporter subunit E [Deltaproteobacteria bacterium]
MFLWNILLTLIWAGLSGNFTFSNVAVGFGLGYVVLWMMQRVLGRSRYFAKVHQVIRFALFFLWELILANLRVAHDVVTPTHHSRPGVIAISLDAKTDVEISMLANLITLTPGTLSLDVSADRRVLYIHAMYIDNDDIDAVRRKIKSGMERRVLELLR